MSEPDFQNSGYQQPRNVTVFSDRRKPTEFEALSSLIENLMNRIDRFDERLTSHMESEASEIKSVIEATMKAGFPDGDPDGHRRHHEAVIKKAEERAEFWQKMRIALAQYGLLGFCGWAIYYLWKAFLMGPR